MKSYMKPTVSFMPLSASSSGGSVSCSDPADIGLIEEILGMKIDPVNGFNALEPCKVPYDIEIFCKFTSANLTFTS